MLRYFVFLAAILAVTNARIANQCVRNPGFLPATTVVEGCNASPCQIHNTRTTNIRISFRAPRRLNNMLTLVTAYMNIGNALLPFQVDLGTAANTCNQLTNARCPVNQGDTVNYTLRLQTRTLPAGHNMPLEIRIVDHGPLVCVNIPVRIIG